MPNRPRTDLVRDVVLAPLAAIERVWPQADVYLSDWHLRHKLQLRLRRARRHSEDDELWQALEGAFSGPHFWEAFKQRLATEGDKEANAWVERWDPIVSRQLLRRPLVSRRGPDYPLTTGGLEAKLEFVKQTIGWRRYGFKNRARLDRLLMLIELQLNGHSDQTAYARIIRDWLLAHSGCPSSRRREVADPLGRPSLRAPSGSKATRPRRPKKITPLAAAPRTSDPSIDAILDDLPFQVLPVRSSVAVAVGLVRSPS